MPVIEWLMTGVNAVLEAAILIPIISIMSVVIDDEQCAGS